MERVYLGADTEASAVVELAMQGAYIVHGNYRSLCTILDRSRIVAFSAKRIMRPCGQAGLACLSGNSPCSKLQALYSFFSSFHHLSLKLHIHALPSLKFKVVHNLVDLLNPVYI